jgi:predicted RNA binding protein YcfA (HicA-like mRNA interferase family)
MNYRKAVIDQLESNGYTKLPSRRGKGSHEMWRKGRHVQTVPRHIDDRNFANDIMKQAGINYRFK